MTKPLANKPIPTKFDPGEDALIRVLAHRSGLPIAQIVRRCIRLMGAEVKHRGRDWNWVQETAVPFLDRAIMEEYAAIVSSADHGTDAVKQSAVARLRKRAQEAADAAEVARHRSAKR